MGALQELATSVALSSGMILSCFLALVFLLSALILISRLDVLASNAAGVDPKYDFAIWMTKNNLGVSPMASVASYLPVLLTAETGFASKISTLIT